MKTEVKGDAYNIAERQGRFYFCRVIFTREFTVQKQSIDRSYSFSSNHAVIIRGKKKRAKGQ